MQPAITFCERSLVLENVLGYDFPRSLSPKHRYSKTSVLGVFLFGFGEFDHKFAGVMWYSF